ncbi:hypothetical protein AURDEDRAFT_165320 [Auricularia subglabra TFB-10046 SS5]|nr:hypothetical protein AURDEDRAFT_165320 [Auricularia subglabra TFB-10046 SS5]
MQPSSTPATASPDEATRDSNNIPAIISELRALDAVIEEKETASATDSEANIKPGESAAAPSRKHLILRLACAIAALLPLWAGWVVFSYFYTQSTLWPLPRVALNANETVSDIAIVVSILLVVLIPLLTTLALFYAARATIPRKLWTFALVFLCAMVLTLVPVFAIYGTLRTHPYSQACDTEVTAYLSSGSMQLFATRTGRPLVEYDFGPPQRGPSGDLAFALSPSNASQPLAFVYDPERRVAGLDNGHTLAFPDVFAGERFTLRANHGAGAVVMKSLGRAPTSRGTIKVCAAGPETGRRVLVAMAVASWVYTRDQ